VHEVSIVNELIRLCRERQRERGAASVRAVRIAVGELASVEPSLLELAWGDLAPRELRGDQDARGAAATLEVEWCPASQTCAKCGEIRERQSGTWMRLCPECGGPLRVEGGDELDLVEVLFEDPKEPIPC